MSGACSYDLITRVWPVSLRMYRVIAYAGSWACTGFLHTQPIGPANGRSDAGTKKAQFDLGLFLIGRVFTPSQVVRLLALDVRGNRVQWVLRRSSIASVAGPYVRRRLRLPGYARAC